jgi:endothelin-converting enzyme/putative endopeptidase
MTQGATVRPPLASLLFALAAFGATPPAQDRTKLPLPPGIDGTVMDASADPCSDFYEYACGGWMKTTEIPAERPLYSRGFVAIIERNEVVLKQILDEAVATKLPAGTPYAKQLADVYATCTDEAKLEKALPEVQAFVKKATAAKDSRELAKSLALLHAQGMYALFSPEAIQDLKNSSEVIASLDQGGLGMPDRDYYLDDDAKKKSVRDAYALYTEAMLALYGEKPADAKAHAAQILEFETRLAKASLSRVARREPSNIYHRLDRAALKAAAADFAWDEYFDALGHKDFAAINVTHVPFFAEVSSLAKQTKPEVWKTYLTWVVLRSSVLALPKKFQDTNFNYASKNLTGATADRPRWKKCASAIDAGLGEALGREFVRRTFGDDSKARTNAMVTALQGAVKANFATLAWMDAPTRAEAAKKLDRMVGNNKIGFPSQWRDYSSLATTRSSFFANLAAVNAFEVKRQLAKVGQPVDRTEWYMSPAAVNAYNEGQKNEIVFPAGILQPPFFDAAATDAVNFGSMGMVVGHEITHGFDDKGRKFDADGNLRDWWTASVGKSFLERAACVKQQYDAYVAVDDLHVKGDLTLGENVADLGGLKLAHAAMTEWYVKKAAADDAYRFSRSQQFFLGFAQSWCTKVRPETARVRATTDSHSPPYWRVIGPLANDPTFQKAFGCADGSKMVRPAKERCEVW